MNTADIEKLLEALEALTSAEGNWAGKKAAILAETTAKDRTNLIEVCSWFEDLSDTEDEDDNQQTELADEDALISDPTDSDPTEDQK